MAMAHHSTTLQAQTFVACGMRCPSSISSMKHTIGSSGSAGGSHTTLNPLVVARPTAKASRRVCACVCVCVCMRVCMLVSLVQAHLTNQACLSLTHAQLTKLGFSWWWRGFWLRLKRHSLCKRTLFPLWKQTKKSADYSTCARTHARTHTRHHKAHQALQVRTASLMAATRKEYSVSFSRPDTVKSSAFPRNCGMNPE